MQPEQCPRCGQENPETGDVCSKCGAPMHAAEPGPVEEMPEAGSSADEAVSLNRERHAGRRPVVVVLAIVLVAVVALAVWTALSPASPDAVAESFLEAARNGDFSEMEPYLSEASVSDAGQSASAKERFATRWRSLLTRNWDPDDSSFEVGEVTYEGNDVAAVDVRLVVGNEQVSRFLKERAPDFGRTTLMMVRENGGWRFDSVRTTNRLVMGPRLCNEYECSVD